MAFKKAELSDELIVRMVELDGTPATNVRVRFPSSVVAAREVNGQEQPLGPATIVGTELETSFKPYQPRTFAVKLAPSKTKVATVTLSTCSRSITICRWPRVWAGPLTAVLTGPQTIRARRKAKPCPLRCCRARSASAEFVSILLQRKNQTPSCRTDKRSLCPRENTIAFICWRPRRITTRKPCSSLETQRLTCLFRNGPVLWANGTIEFGRQLNSRYRRPRALHREPRRAFAQINTVK